MTVGIVFVAHLVGQTSNGEAGDVNQIRIAWIGTIMAVLYGLFTIRQMVTSKDGLRLWWSLFRVWWCGVILLIVLGVVSGL
jgi:undecaprenyl pyrophosphate phosphatase UppP